MTSLHANLAAEIAAHAARLVIDEGLDYADAKRKAARAGGERGRAMPTNEQVEDEVRAQLALFHADTQPVELACLRTAARTWMARVPHLRPHLAGAAWRGTATSRSVVRIDLYADDPKLAEIELLNLGLDMVDDDDGEGGAAVLSRTLQLRELAEPVVLAFVVHDADALRGALKPDARGHSWRGDLRALDRLLAREGDATGSS